jgi:PIN domain nuclease of toxin-antitoxin system
LRLLLDTHVVLWFMLNDPKLSGTASSLLTDRENLCFVSAASHWEIAIKISVGKYRISENFEAIWSDALTRFAALNIEPRHTARLISLPS